MKRISLFVWILFCCFFPAHAQDNPAGFMKRVFTTVAQKDTAAFISLFLTEPDQFQIWSRMRPGSPIRQENGKEVQARRLEILTSVFRNLLKGVPASPTAEYLDCKYQVVKEPHQLLPALTGSIFFRSGDAYYTLGIREAIWINEQWKLAMVDVVQKTDSLQITQGIKDVSAFGSLAIKVKRVIVEDTTFVPTHSVPAKWNGNR